MGIESNYFFEDNNGNIRLNIDEKTFDRLVSDDGEEMGLVLCAELFRQLDELSNELLKYELSDEMLYLVSLVRRNLNNWVVNQSRIIEKIEKLEGA